MSKHWRIKYVWSRFISMLMSMTPESSELYCRAAIGSNLKSCSSSNTVKSSRLILRSYRSRNVLVTRNGIVWCLCGVSMNQFVALSAMIDASLYSCALKRI